MKFAIGVDLGGTNLRIAAVTAAGNMLEKVEMGTKLALGRDAVVSEMIDATKRLTAKFSQTHALQGVGIGVPGIIDERTGMLRKSPNLPGWNDYPVRAEIERRLGTPVVLENDANAAAIGESWLGAARNFDSMCMMTLGAGIGGGIIFPGRVWHGMTGMAAELGHITIDPNGPLCGCGNHGCSEQYASASAVLRMAREAIQGGAAPALAEAAGSGSEFSARTVYQLACQGDQPSQEIFRKVGWALGVLVGNLVNALNLPIYVLGGGLSGAWSCFAPAMFEEVRRRSFVYAATIPDNIAAEISGGAADELKPLERSPRTVITRATLGSDAGLFGTARLPMLAASAHGSRYSAMAE
jgi:glucokinase